MATVTLEHENGEAREVDLFQTEEKRAEEEDKERKDMPVVRRTRPRVRAKFLVHQTNFGKERCQEAILRQLDLIGILDFFGSPLVVHLFCCH